MVGVPHIDIDYCKYGMPYRKRTWLWDDVHEFTPRSLCKKDCNSMVGNKHIGSCGNGLTRYTDKSYTQKDKYKIADQLVYDLFNSMEL